MPTFALVRTAFRRQDVAGYDKARQSIAGPLLQIYEELFTLKGVVYLKSIHKTLYL